MKMDIASFEKKNQEHLYCQIADKILTDIRKGYLKKGDQLLSVRKAAQYYHVSKTSVEHAYEELLANGVIISSAKRGYFVDLSREQLLFREHTNKTATISNSHYRFDFGTQSIDPQSFDTMLWKRYVKDVLEQSEEIASYGDAQGEWQLRLALSSYVYSMRAALAKPEQIVVASSFQSLSYLLFALVGNTCVVGMQEPLFRPLQAVLNDYGISIVSIPSDEEGINIEALYKSEVNIVYVHALTCGKHYQPLASKKRKQLFAWADEKNGLIIEDDHNGELHYETRNVPSLQGMAESERVIYIGSFSRLLLPSLRISYMVLNPSLLARYEKKKAFYSPSASKIEQLALANYILDGHMHRHIKRLKKRYRIKSNAFRQLLEIYFPHAKLYLEESALQYHIVFPSAYDVKSFEALCEKQHIRINQNQKARELTLSFAAITMEDMEQALQEIQTCFQLSKSEC